MGLPEEISKNKKSYTGKFLKEKLVSAGKETEIITS
jgi:excinuclease UvrABC ATPase subunit